MEHPVGWAFFGLTILIVVVLMLNLGILVGSVETLNYSGHPNRQSYSHTCKYLYPTGVRHVSSRNGVFDTAEQSSSYGSCPVLGISN